MNAAPSARFRRFRRLIAIGLLSCQLSSVQAATVYLVRHAEKQPDQSDPELTAEGQCRAAFLAELLQSAGIEQVFSSEYRRTQATARPLAENLGIGVTDYDPRQLQPLAEQLANSSTDTLVVGHSNTTPQLVRLLGGSATEMPETDYQRLYQVSIEAEVIHSRLFMMPRNFDPASCGQDMDILTEPAGAEHH